MKPTVSLPPLSHPQPGNSIVKSPDPDSCRLDKIYDQFFSLKTQPLSEVNKINMASLIAHRRASERPGYYCALCKKNGETPEFYRSHVLRDAFGKVVCPVLYSHSCEICGATGSDSHTRSYCPIVVQMKDSNPNDPKIALMCSNISSQRSHRSRNGSKAPFKTQKRHRNNTK